LISSFAVRRRVTVLMGVVAVLLLGAVSFSRINTDLFPRFDFPAAAVLTEYPGAAPGEVETLVTRIVEEAMGQVACVRKVTSVSQEGRSVVVVEFEWDTDMDYATLEMREKLDLVRSYFPDEAQRPVVVAFDPSALPLMFVAVTGTGRESLVELTRSAEDLVQKRLERIEGVALVSVVGGAEEEVLIAADPDRMAETGVSWLALTSAVTGSGLNLPGGVVNEQGTNLLVRSLGEIEDPSELGQLIVGSRAATIPTPAGPRTLTVPVRLGDVAEVGVVARETSERSRLDGRDCVILAVRKASGANSVAVSDRVETELQNLAPDLPPGFAMEVTMDQADFIATAVGLVGKNAWQGALLAALVLLLFLRNLRSVLVIGTAIPLSIVATFVLMYFSRLTLNLLTVGGLALGVGMLVDNSIVVLENIFRHIEEGHPPHEAAVKGTSEVTTAISASTLTTVVVFLPVVFIGGIAGTLFKELAVTVTFSLLASLVVAVTFVPMAASVLLTAAGGPRSWHRPGGRHTRPPGRARRARGATYRAFLRGALGTRLLVITVAAAALGLSLKLVPGIGTEFIPTMDRGEILFNVELPAGSDLDSTDKVVSEVESIALGVPEAHFVTGTVGTSGGLRMDVAGNLGASSHIGSVQLQLVEMADRDRSVDDVVREMEKALFGVRGGRVTVESVGSFMAMGGIRPVELVLSGDDPDVLADLAVRVAEVVRETRGTINVDDGLVEPRPEVHITYDRDRLAALGLHPAVAAQVVRGAVKGQTVGRMTVNGRDLDMVLRYPAEARIGFEAVEDVVLIAQGGVAHLLSEVGQITRAEGPSIIQREGGQRVLIVSAGVAGRDLGSVVADIVARLDRMEFPEDCGYSVEGEYREMQDAFSGLGLAMALAMVLVYMVMASQFESLSQPFVIMFALPLAAVGVLVALRLSGITLSVPSYIGIIMLAGIVVNNAIVLIDFVNRLRARGLDRDEAVARAAATRLRPILMTTATTVLGLIPMATANLEGSELARSLAVAVIGGLVTSTLLTLVVIPVIYTVVDDVTSFFGRLWGRGRQRSRALPSEPSTPGPA